MIGLTSGLFRLLVVVALFGLVAVVAVATRYDYGPSLQQFGSVPLPHRIDRWTGQVEFWVGVKDGWVDPAKTADARK